VCRYWDGGYSELLSVGSQGEFEYEVDKLEGEERVTSKNLGLEMG
jgi:hypothetical protein